jgi:tRNA-splicing ligase RtcB (3'-phosphate/5'-hydroxy nucleic acid ligase)
VKLINFASDIEPGTLEQATRTASMPFVFPHVALMPDAHQGKGSAVGTVIPTIGAIIPAAVGVDIGCGMCAVLTSYTVDDLAGRSLPELRAAIEAAIPLSPGNYNVELDRFSFTAARLEKLENLALPVVMSDDWTHCGVDLSHSPKWREQLGSLGGGNHFIELCLDELDRVWLTLHSGSRGVGNKIAQRHIRIAQRLCERWWIDLPDPDLAYLVQGTPEFSAYLRELNWAQQFALESRAEMMDRFLWVFLEWLRHEHRSCSIEIEWVNCHHNYTRMEHHHGRDVWVTRKGAVDAHEGVRAMIPGSMGTHSYIVTGKGHVPALCSAPHGAGRRFSRNEAKRCFTEEDLAVAMEGIEYRHGAQWVDEIPGAYKDISQVMEDARDMVTVDHTLRQVLNVKGT